MVPALFLWITSSINDLRNNAEVRSVTLFDSTLPVTVPAADSLALDDGDLISRWDFHTTLRAHGFDKLRRAQIREIQVNVGKLCNQACNHCHVDAGPHRTEIMSWETMEKIIQWCAIHEIRSLDITGGAPELNPHFRRFVDAGLSNGATITSRCNLTVILTAGQEDLADWYANRRVKLICSLPCYSRENLEQQRGKGVFEQSIQALQMLNKLGYGRQPDLQLDLVYNPNGAFLPPAQSELEATYKLRLIEDFDIHFNHLYTLTNLPISRFKHYLERTGEYTRYMNMLQMEFNAQTVPELMCQHIISVDWTGRIYDCDFNQMLNMPAGWRPPRYLWEQGTDQLIKQRIAVDSHCFGCTAGSGSSCGGSLT